jgi:hypothetical protein
LQLFRIREVASTRRYWRRFALAEIEILAIEPT